ncbi:MAG TPA: hypothetical protein VIW92_11240 [Thermoanaerobaculia bacterium]
MGESFYREAPQQTVSHSSQVVDFTHSFTDIETARYFNIASAAWYAGEYVKQVYTDLPQAQGQVTAYPNTFYARGHPQIYLRTPADLSRPRFRRQGGGCRRTASAGWGYRPACVRLGEGAGANVQFHGVRRRVHLLRVPRRELQHGTVRMPAVLVR